tara:strand:- start:7395 stop:8489 length:1095 start_codon:yes stop_codon:yes gene_type:complete
MSFENWDKNGIIERELKLYKQLSKTYGHKFTFITFGNEADLKYLSIVPNSQIIPIYKFFKFRKTKIIKFIQSLFVFRKINQELKSADLIKTNQLMGFWVCLGIKFRFKCPLIIRTGYDIYEFSIKNKKNILKRFSYFLLTQIAIFVSDVYTVTTRANKAFLKKNFLFNNEKILIMPNWVKSNIEYKEIVDRKNEIITVGRLEKQKNYRYLIEEFSNTDMKINIIGEGSLKTDLKKLSHEQNTKVSFLEKMPNSQLIKFLSNFKYFVLPSLFEGNPKVVLEAMQAGCVVIVNNFSGISEVIESEINGFIIDCKKNNLKNLINFLNKNEEVQKNISESGISKVEKDFSLDSYVENENKLYLDLIND